MEEKMYKQSNINPLFDETYLDLWKYFSDDAAQVKDKLWTISIWLFAILGSLLGFIAKQIPEASLAFKQPILVLVVAGVGIAMSLYAYWIITSYGKHIRTAWNRTDYLRRQLPELEEAWKQGYANYPNPNNTDSNAIQEQQNLHIKTDKIPSFVVRIRWLASGFFVLFTAISFIAIYSLFKM